jgi:carboxypeptidase PM20D1
MESVERLIGEGVTPLHDVYLSFGHDEEVFGSGARAVMEHLRAQGIVPGLVVDEGGAVVEGVFPGVKRPTALIGVAEKGVADIGLSVSSAGGHASMPPARQPAGKLARAILRLERKPFPTGFNAPTREMLTTLGRYAPFAYRLVFANLWLFSPLLLRLFTRLSAETNAMCRTTAAITMLEGSPATNVLPTRVRAVANTRITIGETVESVVRRMERTIDDPSVEVRVITPGPPSPVSLTSGPAWELMARAVQETYPDAIVSPYVMLGASDSRHFSGISKGVYRFSPFPLSKAERGSMHGVNEALPIASLAKGIEFYLRLIRGL